MDRPFTEKLLALPFSVSIVDTLETKLVAIPRWPWEGMREAALPLLSPMGTLPQIQAACGRPHPTQVGYRRVSSGPHSPDCRTSSPGVGTVSPGLC